MTTARDIVRGALMMLSIVDPRESMENEAAQDGLDALNDMMHGWKMKGVDISHTTLSLTDTFTMGDQYVEAVKSLLAKRLAEDYGHAVPSQVNRRAVRGWYAIMADYITTPELAVDEGLQGMPSQYLPGEVRS